MTINQVINRIKSLSLAHKQVRTFKQGLLTDFLADQTTKYPGVFLQPSSGLISTSGQATTLSYRLFFIDLVNVSEETGSNEQDVQSDMLLVAMDLIAEMNAGYFDDWALSPDSNLTLLFENENDLTAGCFVDISLRVMFKQDLCQVPTEIINGSPTDNDMNVYDLTYTATGAEGSAIVIPGLQGKKILFITRENAPIYKVSSNPDSTEYTWDGTTIVPGTPTIAAQRFLILYRNY